MIQETDKKKIVELLDVLFLCNIRADSAQVGGGKDRMIIRFFDSFQLSMFFSAISCESKLMAKYKKLEPTNPKSGLSM